MGQARTSRSTLLPPLVEILRTHRRTQLEQQVRGLSERWVFPTEAGTLHHSTASATKPLKAALEGSGVKHRFTIHGYRHTLNDLLRQAEVGRGRTGNHGPRHVRDDRALQPHFGRGATRGHGPSPGRCEFGVTFRATT